MVILCWLHQWRVPLVLSGTDEWKPYIASFHRSSSQAPEFTSSICLKMLEICVRKLNFRDQLEIVCLLIRSLLTSIKCLRKQVAERSTEEEIQAKEGAVISKLWNILRNDLMNGLSPSMSDNYKSESLLRELQVYLN